MLRPSIVDGVGTPASPNMVGIVSTFGPGEYLIGLCRKITFEAGAFNLMPWRFEGDRLVGIGLLTVWIITEKGRGNFSFFV